MIGKDTFLLIAHTESKQTYSALAEKCGPFTHDEHVLIVRALVTRFDETAMKPPEVTEDELAAVCSDAINAFVCPGVIYTELKAMREAPRQAAEVVDLGAAGFTYDS